MAPQIFRSTNRTDVAEPEVYFRIVHIALHGQSGPDTYREQTVEISLGPKGVFENGNTCPPEPWRRRIGALTRLRPADYGGQA